MEKDMTIKIKYSRTDKIVLGIGYTLLGFCDCNNCSVSICSAGIFHGSDST